jgi:hypothetical protein
MSGFIGESMVPFTACAVQPSAQYEIMCSVTCAVPHGRAMDCISRTRSSGVLHECVSCATTFRPPSAIDRVQCSALHAHHRRTAPPRSPRASKLQLLGVCAHSAPRLRASVRAPTQQVIRSGQMARRGRGKARPPRARSLGGGSGLGG